MREDEINEAKLERRFNVVCDPPVERVREIVEPMNGVGPATSLGIVTTLEGVSEVEQVTSDELQAVSDVGLQRAKAIHQRLE